MVGMGPCAKDEMGGSPQLLSNVSPDWQLSALGPCFMGRSVGSSAAHSTEWGDNTITLI